MEDRVELTGEPRNCCLAMDYALDQGYLTKPMLIGKEGDSLNLHAGTPAVKYHAISKRTAKPLLFLAYCPWCRQELMPMKEVTDADHHGLPAMSPADPG